MNKDFFFFKQGPEWRPEPSQKTQIRLATKSQLMTNFLLPPPPNQSQALGKKHYFQPVTEHDDGSNVYTYNCGSELVLHCELERRIRR